MLEGLEIVDRDAFSKLLFHVSRIRHLSEENFSEFLDKFFVVFLVEFAFCFGISFSFFP